MPSFDGIAFFVLII